MLLDSSSVCSIVLVFTWKNLKKCIINRMNAWCMNECILFQRILFSKNYWSHSSYFFINFVHFFWHLQCLFSNFFAGTILLFRLMYFTYCFYVFYAFKLRNRFATFLAQLLLFLALFRLSVGFILTLFRIDIT